MIRRLLLIALVATTALPALVPAGTQDIQEIKSGVVRIVNPELNAQGTGFVVSITHDQSRIFIVTAAHVVKDAGYCDVYLPSDMIVAVRGKVIKTEEGETNGLALLVVVGNKQQFSDLTALEIGDAQELKGSENVQVFGFPGGTAICTVTVGNIARHDGRFLVVSGNIWEGNSGGPVVFNGKVVGLITAINKLALAEQGESIRQYVLGSGLTLPATQIAQSPEAKPTPVPVDKFCQALSRLVDAASDDFYGIIDPEDDEFDSIIKLPDAVRKGTVFPKSIVRYTMAESKKKSVVEKNFYRLIFKIRNCFKRQWEERERTKTKEGTYSGQDIVPDNAEGHRYYYFRAPAKNLLVVLTYNLKTKSIYSLSLAVDKDTSLWPN